MRLQSTPGGVGDVLPEQVDNVVPFALVGHHHGEERVRAIEGAVGVPGRASISPGPVLVALPCGVGGLSERTARKKCDQKWLACPPPGSIDYYTAL